MLLCVLEKTGVGYPVALPLMRGPFGTVGSVGLKPTSLPASSSTASLRQHATNDSLL